MSIAEYFFCATNNHGCPSVIHPAASFRKNILRQKPLHINQYKTNLMKRILPLLVLLCTACGLTYAGTLSGTVYYITTTTPVVGQVITIADTTNTWNTTVTTDAAGHYSVTIPSTVPTTIPGYQINVSTTACGQYLRLIAINSGNPTVNFYICTSSTPVYNLHGTVSLGGIANTDTSIVYLIRKAYSPALGDTTLTAIDSIYTGITGAFSRMYTSMPSGTLLLKAALLTGHPNYSGYLPTYFTSSLNWSGATALGVANFSSNVTNINLIAGTNPGGPGFIGGSVLVGANKGTAVGDPLNKRILILTKSNGEPVAYTYSNTAGKFQFPSVPTGSYKIFGDVWGKSNPVLSFSVTSATPTVNNIVFEENDKKFEGHLQTTGVSGNPALNAISVFPNPATTTIQVNGLETVAGSKTVVLNNMTGTIISRQVLEKGNAVVSVAALPAGVYMLQVQTLAGNSSFRIMK